MEKSKITVKEVESKNLISIRKKIQWQDAGQEMGAIYGELMKYAENTKNQISAPPICLAHQWDDNGGDIECGLIVSQASEGSDRIITSKTYKGNVAVIEHIGEYKKTSESWGELFKYIGENSMENNGVPWEEYITDPNVETDSSKFITNLYQPIK